MTTGVVPPPRTPPDMAAWALVTKAQEGDRDAYGQLYSQYVNRVYRYLMSRVWGDRELAEDLTSETFVRALRRIDSISYTGQDVGAWFVTIARNLLLDHVKRSSYRMEITTADILDSAVDDRSPDWGVIDTDTARVIRECLARLNPLQRECVEMRHLLGMSPPDVAAVLGCGVNAIKARTHRGLVALAGMPELAMVRG